MKSIYKRITTISLLFYITALIIIVIALIFGNKGCQMLFDISCGVFGSLIVAFLTDLGNTKYRKAKDAEIFDRMKCHLKMNCEELPSDMYTSVYECLGYEITEKYTFTEWTDMLFQPDENGKLSEGKKTEIKIISYQISDIKKNAELLQDISKHYYENEYFTEKFEKSLEQLSKSCSKYERNLKKAKFDNCKKVIIDEIKPKVTEIFEELSGDYTEKYNEEKYIT